MLLILIFPFDLPSLFIPVKPLTVSSPSIAYSLVAYPSFAYMLLSHSFCLPLCAWSSFLRCLRCFCAWATAAVIASVVVAAVLIAVAVAQLFWPISFILHWRQLNNAVRCSPSELSRGRLMHVLVCGGRTSIDLRPTHIHVYVRAVVCTSAQSYIHTMSHVHIYM